MRQITLLSLLGVLLLATSVSAVIVPDQVNVQVSFQNTTAFTLQSNGSSRSYVWANGTIPGSDTWSFVQYLDANASFVCPDNADLMRTFQDSYTKMMDTCRASSEGWSQAGDLVGKFTTCQTGLSNCQVERDDCTNRLNQVINQTPEYEQCKNNLLAAQAVQVQLQNCNQQVSTCTTDKQSLNQSVNNGRIIGFIVGAVVFYFLNRKNSQAANMTPQDMKGGF